MDRVALLNILTHRLSASELRTLCFRLGIDHEALPGASKPDKARELVLHCERRGQLPQLEEQIAILRPDISTSEIEGGPRVLPSTVPPSPRPRVSLSKLPATHPDLYGREKELALLDAAWADPGTHMVILVAWGGVGKTALANKWLLGMGRDDYRGADRVLGWSFYSQGAAEGQQTSADPFIAHALEWFGDPDPTRGSPWDKGERLAELAGRGRALLVLDGLEPLQEPPGPEQGHVKDPGLCCLLKGLARHNGGLCVVTTRLPLPDVKGLLGQGVTQVDLDNLSPQAGAAYLAHLEVVGSAEERRAASAEYGGHALALTLLGSYLQTVYDGDVLARHGIAEVTEEPEHGPHARRMLQAYERLYAGRAEGQILQLLGFFDRPAAGGALDALRAEPAVPGVTDLLQGLSRARWRFAVAGLRKARLLADQDPADPDALDAHPLLREYYGERLRRENEAAWREGHRRLYEYYRGSAKEQPDTVAEMAPLYAAVGHGCRAGLRQQALDEVFWRRIRRGNDFYNNMKLGAFGAELALLAGFFEPPWSRVAPGLAEGTQAFVLNEAGFDLRALGRLAEATEPLRAGLEAQIAQQKWENAAIAAANLSGLHLGVGALEEARRAAEQGVELADRSGDAFQRMANRAALADALHQSGRGEEAEALFREVEAMQREDQPRFPLLYSLQGYLYCDLLLGRGAWEEVLRRATEALKVSTRNHWLLAVALDHLSLGRAHLHGAQAAQGRSPDRAERLAAAREEIERAVQGLRRAGQQVELPRGLLARAALRREEGDCDHARADLDEALDLCGRAGLRLHEADARLEYARLHLACGEREQARESLDAAAKMIAAMGYHRRDGEVAELRGEMGE